MAENGERFSENGERFFTGQLYTTTYQKQNRMNMKQITMRYRKNGKTKEKKMTVSEFHQLLTSNEYVRHVRALRTIVGASININDGDIVEAERLPEIYVSVGESVDASTTIGAVGMTGNATGPHLHLEIRANGNTLDPQNYLY